MRTDWKPGTLIYPLPAVLISCGGMGEGEESNLLTASWVSTVCTNPPMCVVGIRPERHSYHIIKERGAFGINLTTRAMARETDWCGVVSGRREDKFDRCGVRADEQYIDPETGAFDMQRAGLLVYAHGQYFGLGEYLGHFGWSVRKKKTKRR